MDKPRNLTAYYDLCPDEVVQQQCETLAELLIGYTAKILRREHVVGYKLISEAILESLAHETPIDRPLRNQAQLDELIQLVRPVVYGFYLGDKIAVRLLPSQEIHIVEVYAKYKMEERYSDDDFLISFKAQGKHYEAYNCLGVHKHPNSIDVEIICLEKHLENEFYKPSQTKGAMK
jgi:hypothetical protein